MHQLIPQTCALPSSVNFFWVVEKRHNSPPLVRDRILFFITIKAAMALLGSGNDKLSLLHIVFPVVMSTHTNFAGSPKP